MPEEMLALVVPCYNPPTNWHSNLIECFNQFCEGINRKCRLILVNDGSSTGVNAEQIDEIEQAIKDFRYITYTDNRGKGYALRRGIEEAGEHIVITTDVDFPYTNQSMLKVHDSLLRNGGLVLGTRKKTYYQKVPLFRKLLSLSFRLTIRMFLKLQVDDTQCGLKGMDQEARRVFLETKVDGYLFDLEFVKLISTREIPINRVNATLKPSIEFTNMSPRILMRESANLLKIMRL